MYKGTTPTILKAISPLKPITILTNITILYTTSLKSSSLSNIHLSKPSQHSKSTIPSPQLITCQKHYKGFRSPTTIHSLFGYCSGYLYLSCGLTHCNPHHQLPFISPHPPITFHGYCRGYYSSLNGTIHWHNINYYSRDYQSPYLSHTTQFHWWPAPQPHFIDDMSIKYYPPDYPYPAFHLNNTTVSKEISKS